MTAALGVLVALAAAAAAVAPGAAAAAAAAPPAGVCHNPTPARPVVAQLPWAQQVLAPKAVWPHSTGEGVLVAVVDSGVDADHPQLSRPGKVLRGQDFDLVGDLPGNFDCVSHGTAVAGLIAADPVDGVGFAGLAPGARILPVRVTERDVTENGGTAAFDPVVLARGIRYAADQGARVVNLSIAGAVDNQYVREAVAHAQSKDALVVAAVGNQQQDGLPGPPSFPAGYDGVLGVGAVDIAGSRAPSSQVGPQVDLVAPGAEVVAATRAGGHDYWRGTSFAAPLVSATAALVRAKWPELTAPEVAARILATATPAPGGEGSAAYGVGLVNPYRAVTEGLADGAPQALPEVVVPPEDPARLSAAAWWAAAADGTRLMAGVLAGATVVGLVSAWVFSRGRRGKWRPRRAVPADLEPVRDELPDEVFLVQR